MSKNSKKETEKKEKVTKKDESEEESSKEKESSEKKSSTKKKATSSPKKASKKPTIRKSEYLCAICEEPYKSGSKHWKTRQKTNIPGYSISERMFELCKELSDKYTTKDEIPKTHRLCITCNKEKYLPHIPKKKKVDKEKEK